MGFTSKLQGRQIFGPGELKKTNQRSSQPYLILIDNNDFNMIYYQSSWIEDRAVGYKFEREPPKNNIVFIWINTFMRRIF